MDVKDNSSNTIQVIDEDKVLSANVSELQNQDCVSFSKTSGDLLSSLETLYISGMMGYYK